MKETSRKPEAHKFSPDIIDRVRRGFQTDNWHGLCETMRNWLVICLAAVFSLYTWRQAPWWIGTPVYLASIFFIGGRQRGLADILHQASHRTLAKSHRLGVLIGTVCSGYPLLQSFTGYWESHVHRHHHYLGDPDLDPDYIEYQRRGLCGSSMNRDRLRRYLIGLFTVRSMVAYGRYLLVNRIWSRSESPFERCVRFPLLAAAVATCVYMGWGGVIVTYWFVPLFTTHAWIGAFIELLEHYPLIETAPFIDIYLTRNRECGWFGNFLLGLQTQEGYHLVHHRFPQVPRWRLREVHLILMEDREYAALHTTRGWAALLRQLFFAVPPGANASIMPSGLQAGCAGS